MQKLKQDDLNFKVLFVGDGKDNTLYRKMVKDKKLENNIIFVRLLYSYKTSVNHGTV